MAAASSRSRGASTSVTPAKARVDVRRRRNPSVCRPIRRSSRPAARLPTPAARAASPPRPVSPISSMSARRDADLAEQLRQAVLRMAEHGRFRRGSRQHRPGRLVHLLVEPRQHDRAVRQPRDRRQQFRRRRNGAGRARRDHRPGRRICPAAVPPPAGSARCDARPGWTGRVRRGNPANARSRSTGNRASPATSPTGFPAPAPQAASSPSLPSRSRPSARRGRAPARWRRPPKPAPPSPRRTAPRHAPAAASSRRAPAAPDAAAGRSRKSAARGRARPRPPHRRPPRPRRTRRAA